MSNEYYLKYNNSKKKIISFHLLFNYLKLYSYFYTNLDRMLKAKSNSTCTFDYITLPIHISVRLAFLAKRIFVREGIFRH